MALIFSPVWPWHYVAGLILIATLGLLAFRGWRDRWAVLARRWWARVAVVMLSLLAVLLLTGAAFNPQWVAEINTIDVHLVVAVDVSDSVLRAEGGWPHIRSETQARLSDYLAELPAEIQETGLASVLTFRDGAAVAAREMPLAELPPFFNQLNESDFAAGDGTNIEAGLDRAAALIEQSRGLGAVVLVSDGHQTDGNALDAAARLSQRGIPIYVFPVESQGPELAITAANLPRQVNARAETFVRGVMHNSNPNPVQALIALSQHSPRDPLAAEMVTPLAGESWLRFRQPLRFQGVGLQFVDVSLSRADGDSDAGQIEHRRRFFTHVLQPPRILAVGGDNRWAVAMPPDVAQVDEIAPGDIAPFLPDYDAVVISSIAAPDFPHATLTALAEAVTEAGLGLMLLNGGHQGMDSQTETILMSYTGTPLDDILPVSGEPRLEQGEPEERHVVILIDGSGSMAGWAIEKSKEIARHVVVNLLRPTDRLDVIVFTAGAQQLITNQTMDEAGKEEALRAINAIQADGGTDPADALALLAERKLNNCGMIFISDGEFGRVNYRPDCRATVFAIGYSTVPSGSPLFEFADPFPVGQGFDPNNIEIPYFEQGIRDKFFEEGEYTPLTMEFFSRRVDKLPVPDLPLVGSAVSYIKDDADLMVVRPKLTDPILAYRESGAGYVGTFTTGFTPDWLSSDAGRRAISAWILRTIPYLARDRYDFQLVDYGQPLELNVGLMVDAAGQIPGLTELQATVELADGAQTPVSLRRDPNAAATFSGFIQLPRTDASQRAWLVLSETGPDALSRPQRIPLLVPPAGEVETSLPAEAYSYGLNEPLLRQLAGVGAGQYDPPAETRLFRAELARQAGAPLWPWLFIIAVMCYLGAIALRRLDL